MYILKVQQEIKDAKLFQENLKVLKRHDIYVQVYTLAYTLLYLQYLGHANYRITNFDSVVEHW